MKTLPRSVSALRASTVVCVIGLAAFAATSCTSTGSSPGVTSALAVAPTDTAAGDAQTSLPSGGNTQVTPEALALAGTTETNALQAINGAAKPAEGKAELAKANEKTEAQGSAETKTEEVQVASAATVVAQPPVRTSLFGSMTKTPAPVPETPAAAAEPVKPEGKAAPETTVADSAPPEETKPAATAQKNNGALLRLFSNNRSKPAGQRLVAVIEPKSKPSAPADSSDGDLPSAESFAGRTEHLASLPGVRPNAGIQIMQRDSLYDDDDVEAAGAPVILASAAGLARLAPNGLKVQRESVDVACLKPQLVGILKLIERKYGKSVIVTSGYRSPPYNRKVNGAKASLHMSCAAADIQVPGISKWELANYARAMTGRGGVGTYCHTESVHVDIGPRRDWNWRCSKGKG
ncbi:D-Ala-D-Ala carboxypeptidase family metallohydrolase [Phyllobacterium sp. SB3]|uniref:YcbK family protein n=1 Tax=Phyllobacterium sp. SB3 TaxID=3156073 RepID=UPI0032AF8150